MAPDAMTAEPVAKIVAAESLAKSRSLRSDVDEEEGASESEVPVKAEPEDRLVKLMSHTCRDYKRGGGGIC